MDSHEVVISNFKNLCEFIDKFLSGEDKVMYVTVSSKLRKPMRQLPTLYPNLHYFAYGVGLSYSLCLSKEKFTINFVSLTHSSKKLFIERTGLKIGENITPEEIELLDPYMGLTRWFELLSDCLLELGGEKEFKSKHFDLEKKIWSYLKKKTAKSQFNTLVIEPVTCKYTPNPVIPVKGSNLTIRKNASIYYPENNSRYFISVDMKHANFQVLKMYGIIESTNWSDFMSSYTTIPYFSKLKKLRLKVLTYHELHSAKQKICWENLMITILHKIVEQNIINVENFAISNGDELIFHTTKDTMKGDLAKMQEFLATHYASFEFSFKTFQLHFIPPRHYVWFDPHTNMTTFKCVDYKSICEVVKRWNENVSTNF